MPEEEGGYLSGVAPALKTSGNAGNAVFRARNFHFLKDDKNFDASEGFNAPQSIYNDFVNGRLAPEFHYNTIPGSLNTKGFYRNDNGKKVYAVIRDAYDPSLREKRVVEIGPDGLDLTGQEYVSQYFTEIVVTSL